MSKMFKCPPPRSNFFNMSNKKKTVQPLAQNVFFMIYVVMLMSGSLWWLSFVTIRNMGVFLFIMSEKVTWRRLRLCICVKMVVVKIFTQEINVLRA